MVQIVAGRFPAALWNPTASISFIQSQLPPWRRIEAPAGGNDSRQGEEKVKLRVAGGELLLLGCNWIVSGLVSNWDVASPKDGVATL